MDRLASFDEATTQLRVAFEMPAALEKVCRVPGGSVSGAGLLALRIFDVTVHCWDLARAIGASEAFPESMINHAWEYAAAHDGQDGPDAVSRRFEDAHSTLAALVMLTGRTP